MRGNANKIRQDRDIERQEASAKSIATPIISKHIFGLKFFLETLDRKIR